MPTPLRQLPAWLVRRSLFVAFTLSGFAGLIYESIWSHYLKLLLGHAAYAQTLVLVLFMGGMAIGAWLCGRYSSRIARPLVVYAAVEFVLGVFAFGFDAVFRSVSDWVLLTAAPALAEPLPIEALKWGVSALLIAPACVLLGATFPLVSAGVVRLAPREAGNALGWLYFSNSLGAVAGVLTSGFVLIAWIGLPGTLLTAGLCNFLLAIVVYGLGQRTPVVEAAPAAVASSAVDAASARVPLLLATAFLTGAASFFYEIGWIRMLSLVLGAATHSFELMLGAFILGLALGALFIRNRIERVANPLRTLAWVQVLMGTAAMGTLVVYGYSFGWMGAVVRTVAHTDTGYAWFNVLSQAICWALMLPVTFFAGMTLPLITALLLRTAAGEGAIGRVYAANTWGAIVGVVLAVHVAMPYFGLRNVVVVGAVIDLALGLYLFYRASGSTSGFGRVALAALLLVSVSVAALVRFDASQLASGVYRHGRAAGGGESVLHRDGRTASVDVVRNKSTQALSILTNGKPDAALRSDRASEDDYVMILAGVLPLALKPQAQDVAVIGMGAGRSTHVFLGHPGLASVDTIEIEPAMVEGARQFGEMSGRTFADPRSHIYIEDAKTYFARHQKRYDLIMSEPSNPWVSGVASLFSVEFYRQIKPHLAPGGVFVQWLQLYEFDDTLVTSVLAGLVEQFPDFVVYMPDNTNLLIAAVAEGTVPALDPSVLQIPELQKLTATIGVRNLDDLLLRRAGGRELVSAYVQASGSPANSDYFPYLDQRAAKFRFLQGSGTGLTSAHPVLHRMENTPVRYRELSAAAQVPQSVLAERGRKLVDYLAWKHLGGAAPSAVTTETMAEATRLEAVLYSCGDVEIQALWQPVLEIVGQQYLPYMDLADAQRLSKLLRSSPCKGTERPLIDTPLDFFDAVAARDWAAVARLGSAQLEADRAAGREPGVFVVREVLLADYQLEGVEGVAARVGKLGRNLPRDPSIRFLRFLATGSSG